MSKLADLQYLLQEALQKNGAGDNRDPVLQALLVAAAKVAHEDECRGDNEHDKNVSNLKAQMAAQQKTLDAALERVTALEKQQQDQEAAMQDQLEQINETVLERVTTLEKQQQDQKQLFSGITESSDWKNFTDTNGIMVTVDISHCNFPAGSKPSILTSLVGHSDHWATVGATSIYDPTHFCFKVYVRGNGWNIRTAHAIDFVWQLQWVAFL